MIIYLSAIVIGIAFLVWSADKFVAGAASLARNLGMSTLLIGLTVVSFGTSAPEILVSITAASMGASGMAVGNALGSNIANIGLVMGITALIAPLPVRASLMRKELPLLGIVTLLAGILMIDQNLGRIDGLALLLVLAATLYLFSKIKPEAGDIELLVEEEQELPHLSMSKAVFWLIFGLIMLILSSRLLVWAATQIAMALGISDLVIGLTIVAIGTSLPELAASVMSALRKHHDIAIGNVIGSNIFNLLAVMSLPGIIAPYDFGKEVLWRDYGLMFLLTALLIGLCYHSLRHPVRGKIGRITGLILCLCYLGYLILLYLQS